MSGSVIPGVMLALIPVAEGLWPSLQVGEGFLLITMFPVLNGGI